MLEYGKSGIYNNNRLPAEKKKEEENTRDRSVPDGSDKKTFHKLIQNMLLIVTISLQDYVKARSNNKNGANQRSLIAPKFVCG